MERLRAIRNLARALGALHQAITYQDVVSNVEAVTRGQMELGLDFWLRKILQSLGKPNQRTQRQRVNQAGDPSPPTGDRYLRRRLRSRNNCSKAAALRALPKRCGI